MNILILIDTMGFGGAEKQALLDANSLVMKGKNVVLACFHTGELISFEDTTVYAEEPIVDYEERVNLWGADELRALLESAGLSVFQEWGE